MKRKLPEKFFEQNQRAKTRKWKFFNLNQALWGAGNREFRNEEPLFLAGSKKKRISPLEATDALTHESWNRKDSQVIFRTAEEGAEKNSAMFSRCRSRLTLQSRAHKLSDVH